MCHLAKLGCVLALLSWASAHSYALSSDQAQPFNIAADYAVIDRKANTITYQGHVQLAQGTTRVQAEQLIAQGDGWQRLVKVTALGRKARYRTVPAPGQLEFIAKADVIAYYPLQGEVLLLGGAEVEQGKNTFKGPRLEYNVKSRRVVAPASNAGKAHLVLEPEQIK